MQLWKIAPMISENADMGDELWNATCDSRLVAFRAAVGPLRSCKRQLHSSETIFTATPVKQAGVELLTVHTPVAGLTGASSQ